VKGENPTHSTCWELVHDAAHGREAARSEFAIRYEAPVRRYLGYRWRSGRLRESVDDAVQEVFLEFFRRDGALSRVEPDRSGGFRAFLYGVVQNVARRVEDREFRRQREISPSVVWKEGPAADDPTLSLVFDRAWLDTVLGQAVQYLEERAQEDAAARKRVEILKLRFGDGRPYKEIAGELGIPVSAIYREAEQAREEFKRSLFDVVARDSGGSPASIERECREILERIGAPG
jgi:RNA polymerase sigma factor (sigma-70 family)